jgi:hypothetical protein
VLLQVPERLFAQTAAMQARAAVSGLHKRLLPQAASLRTAAGLRRAERLLPQAAGLRAPELRAVVFLRAELPTRPAAGTIHRAESACQRVEVTTPRLIQFAS